MGLILDSSLLIADERERFDLSGWLRGRPPFNARIARMHSHVWAQLVERGRIIGAHDLIIAATALSRNWSVATFNVSEFENVPGLTVLEPEG